MTNKNVLISGAGIAGLTLGILLKEKGWEPTVIERDPAMRTEGYMIDFFSTGWDVAERMELVDELRKITYPIDALQYVDRNGKPYLSLPVTSVRKALAGKYTYLLRTDLERILFERAQSRGLSVNFGTTIRSLRDNASGVTTTLSDGSEQSFALVFGADGVHSRVRELAFGPEASSTASWDTTSPRFMSKITDMASVPRSPSMRSPTARSGSTRWARTA